MHRTVAIVACFAFVSGCIDYATEETVGEVRATVENLDRRMVSDVSRIRAEVGLQSLAISEVKDSQKSIEEAMAAMGDGFNTLSGAVVEAHEASRAVARRQDRLERTVDRRTAAALPPPESERSLLGRGVHRRTGAALPTYALTSGSPPRLDRISEGNGEDSAGSWSVELIGRRLYAIGPDGPCLEVLARDESGDAFSAADCADPFAIWRFE